MLTYSDIAERVAAGETDEQIADALAADWQTRHDIDIARLMGELLIPGGIYAKVEAAKDTNPAARQLYDVVNERRIATIRTATNPMVAQNIRQGLDGLNTGGLFEGLPYTPEQIEGAFYALGGGLRYRKEDGSTYSAEDIRAVIDAHELQQARNALRQASEPLWSAALAFIETAPADATLDDVVAAINEAVPAEE